MSCFPELRCNVGHFYSPWYTSEECFLCGIQKSGCKTTGCGQNWPPGAGYGQPTDAWIGHGTQIWLLTHGADGVAPQNIDTALMFAKDWFRGQPPNFDGRGHYTLRCYGGHWALERFLSAQTIPFALSDAMMRKTDDAVRWFFDTDAMLDDPVPYRRDIMETEIAERIQGYQDFIDKETRRPWNQERYLVLPPLRELPYEQQRRLVGWWDRLWWDFLDLHPDWRWTPLLGFWQVGERIFPLI